MDVLLDNARDQLDFPTFVSHLEAGLSVCARRTPPAGCSGLC